MRSIYEHCGDDRPLIYVLDDGKLICVSLRSVLTSLVGRSTDRDRIDIGLSAGRIRLVEAAQTRMVIFSDDDHVFGPQTRLNDLVRSSNRVASIYWQHSASNPSSKSRWNAQIAQFIRWSASYSSGEYRRTGDIAECAFVCNCFVAYRDILQAIAGMKISRSMSIGFLLASQDCRVRVGVAVDHVFPHIHVDPPDYKRHRPVFLRAALRKHGLRNVLWNETSHRNSGSAPAPCGTDGARECRGCC